MSHTIQVNDVNGASIKVGTTGTIASLMIQEIESMKHTPQTPTYRKKLQNGPVSVPCNPSPRKSTRRRSSLDGYGSSNNSSSSNEHNYRRNLGNANRPRHSSKLNGHGIPMLASDDNGIDRNQQANKTEKKVRTHIVEVVDVKCSSNPMSSRLRKLGFSKLSETIN